MTEEEIEEYTKKVPFDPKLFQEFGHYQPIDLSKKFYYVKDLENLMDLLARMFQYLPDRRITAAEALQHPFFKDVLKK